MGNLIDSKNLNKQPFVINNQIYILGNPVISTQTLEQLVYVLDQLGSQQPIVIINPEATTVPDFDKRLSQLIQNNRRVQPHNQTTEDKYRFKDMTDDDLLEVVNDTCLHNPILDRDSILDMYRGLRARAQAQFTLEILSRERDALWAAHCANPASTEGSDRYAELHYTLIPQAQKVYEDICQRLQNLDAEHERKAKQTLISEPKTNDDSLRITDAQSSVLETNTSKQGCDASVASNSLERIEPTDSGLIPVDNSETVSTVLWGPWRSMEYMQMPLTAARKVIESPSYSGLRLQQHDVLFEGKIYKAVEPEYLIALGIDLIPDGNPIVYTDIGTFKRVGYSKEPITNLKYWYPTPKCE